jgi:hypothetical protein
MSKHWRTDEVRLRRNLLFRLLTNFDFDNPIFRYEPISTPIAERELVEDSDAFIFSFQS